MKANRTPRTLLADQRAQVGIGTMIVFIASVLVAAIAAAVLLDVSGRLQERSSRTGLEATQQVASNLAVKSMSGFRDDPTVGNQLDTLYIGVQLAPGAFQIDLSQMVIELSDGLERKSLSYTDLAAGADTFSATALRDADNTFSAETPVMSSGDLVHIEIDMDANGMAIVPRKSYQITLIPEVGVHVDANFQSPSSFGSDRYLKLR